MKLCALCGQEVAVDRYFSRKLTCKKCGGDLHICMNCRFYSEAKHNKCNETKAEFQRSRDRANFCDYFVFKESTSSSSPGVKSDAMKALDDLFRKP